MNTDASSEEEEKNADEIREAMIAATLAERSDEQQ